MSICLGVQIGRATIGMPVGAYTSYAQYLNIRHELCGKLHSTKEVIFYAFIFILCSCLLFLPSSNYAQNPKEFLTFRNCLVGFLYPEEWKNFISDSSDCEESYTQINFPPSLSQKIPPSIIIKGEKCCVTSYTGESPIYLNMSLEEYVNEELNFYKNFPGTTITNSSGPTILGGYPAYKIVAAIGSDASNPSYLAMYTKKGDRMYKISYWADPSAYFIYLPDIYKIADSFRMFVS